MHVSAIGRQVAVILRQLSQTHELGGEAARPAFASPAGDLLVIPAGMPHQFQLTAGDTIRYLTIKVPRGAKAGLTDSR